MIARARELTPADCTEVREHDVQPAFALIITIPFCTTRRPLLPMDPEGAGLGVLHSPSEEIR